MTYIKCPDCNGDGRTYEGCICPYCWGGCYIEVESPPPPISHTEEE